MNAPALAPEIVDGQHGADSLIIIQFHLMLAIIVLASYLAVDGGAGDSTILRPLFLAFAVYSLAVFLACRDWLPAHVERTLLYLEVCWLGAIIHATGGAESNFFSFYVVSVMLAGFRFGHQGGSMLTLAATLLFGVAAVAEAAHLDVMRMLMRGCFLLTLGSLTASLGEANLRQHRRQAFLRGVIAVANAGCGVERSVAEVLERCRGHFGAGCCLLLTQQTGSRHSEVRVADGTGLATSHRLPNGAPLAQLDAVGTLLFEGQSPAAMGWRRLFRPAARLLRHDGAGHWTQLVSAGAEQVAAQYETRSFISVTVNMRGGSARLTICAGARRFERADAVFLEQAAAQVLPAIEQLYQLERMATVAEVRLRRASASHAGLDASLAALRGQQLRAKQWYDVDIELDLHGAERMDERLSAAVLQLSEEGISNICKHTQARRASLRIDCDAQLLRLDIENDAAAPVPHFVPRSLAARASAMGGYAAVEQRRGATVVHIAIPV